MTIERHVYNVVFWFFFILFCIHIRIKVYLLNCIIRVVCYERREKKNNKDWTRQTFSNVYFHRRRITWPCPLAYRRLFDRQSISKWISKINRTLFYMLNVSRLFLALLIIIIIIVKIQIYVCRVVLITADQKRRDEDSKIINMRLNREFFSLHARLYIITTLYIKH